MILNTQEIFLTVGILLLVIIQAYGQYEITKYSIDNSILLDSIMQDVTSYKLYQPENKDKLYSNGVYFSTGYFCVKTEGRNYEEIENTEKHEWCHAFVDMDFQHFCNGSNQTAWNVQDYLGGERFLEEGDRWLK